MNLDIETYFEKTQKWQSELNLLRKIVLSCGLDETYKWKHPCYTFQNKNIVIIHAFKEYGALLFFKGALLNNEHSLLIQQSDKVQSAKQIRFTSNREIIENETIIKNYIFEAIEVEKAGLKVQYKKTSEFSIPNELQSKFEKNDEFKNAFFALTQGRQKGYLIYFSDAKNVATRESRIEKYFDRILNNKGINDCICGLSKKMPNCDGSHKILKT